MTPEQRRKLNAKARREYGALPREFTWVRHEKDGGGTRMAVWGDGLVSVTMTRNLRNGMWEEPTVNWSAIGPQKRKIALAFAAAIVTATQLGQQWWDERDFG